MKRKLSDLLGETTTYDKKVCVENLKPRSWLKSVSAFANTYGGTLIFGVSDDDEIIGLSNSKKESEKISELLKDHMDPVPQNKLEIKKLAKKEIVLLHVYQGAETPYYYISDGTRIAFVRIGNQSVPAKSQDLRRLVLSGLQKTYDMQVTQYTLNQYSFTRLKAEYYKRTGEGWTDQNFRSFGLITDNNILTTAGALFADDSPVYPSRVFCTRWHGTDKSGGVIDAADDKELSGSLLSLLDGSMNFVRDNTKHAWMKLPDRRLDLPEYPERAVQEGIVNALIHRDYLLTGSEIHIDIFDDRMEIYSPGGMYDGTKVQDLNLDHVPSKRRNPVIADLFNRLHLMERRGSGFSKIQTAYRKSPTYQEDRKPQFYSDTDTFILTLWNLNYNIDMQKIKGNGLFGPQNGSLDLSNVSIEPENMSIDSSNVSINSQNMSIDASNVSIDEKIRKMHVRRQTQEHIVKIHQKYGGDKIFGRREILALLHLKSPTTAGNLINKMCEAGILELAKGYSKGKYHFVIKQ